MPYKDKNKQKEYYILNREKLREKAKLRYEKSKSLKEKNKIVQNCLICNKEFTPKGRWHKRPRKYCCRECYNKAVSTRMLCNSFNKGRKSWNKGLKTGSLSEDHKNKIRQKSLLNGNKPPTYYGSEHPNWVDGNYKTPVKQKRYMADAVWRKEVFKRDNYTCQKCKQRGGELNAHHIFNYASYVELRTDINNGITFCKECHVLFHTLFSKKNNNDIQVKEFLNPSQTIVEVK